MLLLDTMIDLQWIYRATA